MAQGKGKKKLVVILTAIGGFLFFWRKRKGKGAAGDTGTTPGAAT